MNLFYLKASKKEKNISKQSSVEMDLLEKKLTEFSSNNKRLKSCSKKDDIKNLRMEKIGDKMNSCLQELIKQQSPAPQQKTPAKEKPKF